MRTGFVFALAAAALVVGASAEWPWHNTPSEVPVDRRTHPRGAGKLGSPAGVLALPKKAASASGPAAAEGRDGSAGKAPEPEVTAAFDKLDKNHDGMLNRQEFAGIKHASGVDDIMVRIHSAIASRRLCCPGAAADDLATCRRNCPPSIVLLPGAVFPRLPSSQASVSQLGSGHTFWGAFVHSLIMIIVTELGDKTFFLAALMAMRHPRSTVFIAAIGALGLMHVLSVGIGFALPSLLPRIYTHYAAIGMVSFACAAPECVAASRMPPVRRCLARPVLPPPMYT